MDNDTNDGLASTMALLAQAFPNGIGHADYVPLLNALYPHMSDRALATVIGRFNGVDHDLILNDVYRCVTTDEPSAEERCRMEELLDAHGFREWRAEDS